MKSPIPHFLPLLIAGLLPFAAQAQTPAPAPAPVQITDGYARAANPKSGAAFMSIHNGGDAACTLSGVSSDAAERAELHTSREVDGVMRMVMADPITIAPGESHDLARGGDHVMLMGLHQPLADGQELRLVLDLGDCGPLEVTLPVDSARKPGMTAHDGHGAMSHMPQP